ncbi:MAG: hypothetical protein ACK5LC_16375 [Coprobacillaceae bacterium]
MYLLFILCSIGIVIYLFYKRNQQVNRKRKEDYWDKIKKAENDHQQWIMKQYYLKHPTKYKEDNEE